MRVLITGGAGFIGSHIADRLIEHGYEVVIYDNLDPQVHKSRPDYLNPKAEFIEGDIRDRSLLQSVLRRVDAVCHQAAVVGVGQSMYQIERYMDVNTRGTALLLDLIANDKRIRLKKLVVASSMSIYGEGAYYCPQCRTMRFQTLRPLDQIKQKQWEHLCSSCRSPLEPRPTPENKPLWTTSVYAQSKKDQEELCLIVGQAYDVPTVALRYFNVYGPRQSLNNPYTGVCAIFSSRILNRNAPVVYEDGGQSRDFIHVRDIALANQLALEKPEADMQVFNVGTGQALTIKRIAASLIELLGMKGVVEPQIRETYREGDIRHCFADITKIRTLLGFEPQVSFEDGMKELIGWVTRQKPDDHFSKAEKELIEKGLLKE